MTEAEEFRSLLSAALDGARVSLRRRGAYEPFDHIDIRMKDGFETSLSASLMHRDPWRGPGLCHPETIAYMAGRVGERIRARNNQVPA